jgi:hypothetical protein
VAGWITAENTKTPPGAGFEYEGTQQQLNYFSLVSL